MKPQLSSISALVLFSILSIQLSAAPLVTDRPDFTESSDVIPLNATQVEGGYTYSNDGSPLNTAGEILIRRSISSNSEIRLGIPSYYSTQSGLSGFGDSSIGLKLKFDPQSAWIIGTTLPTGAPDFRDNALNPFIKYCWGMPVTSQMVFSSNIGVQQSGAENEQFIQWLGSASLGIEIMPKWGAYTEIYAFSPNTKDTSFLGFINAGLTYQYSDDLQADVRIGSSIDRAEFFIGTGISARFWD